MPREHTSDLEGAGSDLPRRVRRARPGVEDALDVLERVDPGRAEALAR